MQTRTKYSITAAFIFIIFSVLLVVNFYWNREDPIFSKTNPKLKEIVEQGLTPEQSKLFERELELAKLWNESVSTIDRELREKQDFKSEEVLQAAQTLKNMYFDESILNLERRRVAASTLATQVWKNYNREFLINHIFSGPQFEEMLDGTSHWDVHLAIVNLYLESVKLDPKFGISVYFQAADLLLDYVLAHPKITKEEKNKFFQQAKNLLLDHRHIYENYHIETRKTLPRQIAKWQHLQAKILAKSELLGSPISLPQNWREMFEDAIELYENNEVKKDLKRGFLVRLDFAHLVGEIDGEKSRTQILQILDPFFDRKNKEFLKYISTILQVESSPEHDRHFHKRGLQILGNLDPRFKNLMLENGFEESFFTNFSLPIYPLPPQN